MLLSLIIIGCSYESDSLSNTKPHKKEKIEQTRDADKNGGYAEIGNTSTVTRNGVTYTCTYMGGVHVKCTGPPIE
tara:strand:+ start:381 stop:605 length:225 start_codon:yes stop_codon:yes gene_type:complete